jgi:hypothetical protein
MKHAPRHVLEEHRVARTAAVGAAGAVVIGAAFGLTGGSISGGNDPFAASPSGASLDRALDHRADQAASRGLARASLAPGAGIAPLPRAQAPVASPLPAAAGPPAAPLPEVPEDCQEYSGNRQIGCTLLSEFGFGLDQMPALDALWSRESGWNHLAANQSSGAYGIPQALPGSKMGSVGSDWETNPATQIRWGLGYIRDRYGDPAGAWSFFQANGWY